MDIIHQDVVAVPVVAANHVLAGVMEDALVIAMMVAPLIAGMVAIVG